MSEAELITLFRQLMYFDETSISDPTSYAFIDDLIDLNYVVERDRNRHGQRVISVTPSGVEWYMDITSKPVSSNIEKILNERQNTYGEYRNVASVSQALKDVLSNNQRYSMRPYQIEALDMICNKLARIVNGDPNYIESWKDLAGYSTLVVKELEKTEGATDAKVTRTKVINGVMVDITNKNWRNEND